MCHVRTRSKREASLQNLTRKTSHMLNIPYNFLNGFELISKMTRGTSQSAEIRQSAEKSHVWKRTSKKCRSLEHSNHQHPGGKVLHEAQAKTGCTSFTRVTNCYTVNKCWSSHRIYTKRAVPKSGSFLSFRCCKSDLPECLLAVNFCCRTASK